MRLIDPSFLVLNSRSTLTLVPLNGRSPWTSGASGSYLAFSKPVTNLLHRSLIRLISGLSKVRSSSYRRGCARPRVGQWSATRTEDLGERRTTEDKSSIIAGYDEHDVFVFSTRVVMGHG